MDNHIHFDRMISQISKGSGYPRIAIVATIALLAKPIDISKSDMSTHIQCLLVHNIFRFTAKCLKMMCFLSAGCNTPAERNSQHRQSSDI